MAEQQRQIKKIIDSSPYLSTNSGWKGTRDEIVLAYYEARKLKWLDSTISLDDYAKELRNQVKNPSLFHSHVVSLRTALESKNLAKALAIAPNHLNLTLGNRTKIKRFAAELNQCTWGQFDKKIAKATEILKIKPDHSKALFFRGHAYYNHKKDMDLAWKDLSKAYEIDPTYYWTVFYVGLTAYELNDPTTAIALINEAIKLENRFEPHQCLAKIYFNLNNFTKAIEHYNKAIQLNPEKAVTAKNQLPLTQQLLKLSNELDAFAMGPI